MGRKNMAPMVITIKAGSTATATRATMAIAMGMGGGDGGLSSLKGRGRERSGLSHTGSGRSGKAHLHFHPTLAVRSIGDLMRRQEGWLLPCRTARGTSMPTCSTMMYDAHAVR